MTKIFIGMPIYNGERFLGEAINSLRNQTFVDWNLFISDDSSTDSTELICREFAKEDSRITYFKQEKNVGMFPNFKFVLDKADTEYFMWAAQDDLWEEKYLETCLEHFNKDRDLGLATTCTAAIDSFGRTLLEEVWMTNLSGKPGYLQVAKYVLQPEILGKCNLMYSLFKTEALRKTWQAYPQRSTWGQDYMFSLAAISRFGVVVSHNPMFKKRLGGASSPQLSIHRQDELVTAMQFTNPKNHMFPFGRFWAYFNGHMEALNGTPYKPLAAILLIARLPRAFIIHIKERSFKKYIKRLVKKMS